MKTKITVRIIAAVLSLATLLICTSCELFVVPTTTQTPQKPVTEIHIDGADLPEYIEKLVKLDELFKTYSYEGIDEEAMNDAILKAYVAATGDIYAEYMNAEEYEKYNSESNSEFIGIGISIINTIIEINGYNYKALQVISVFENSPAIENDVRVGDCIVYVGNNEERVLVDLLGYSVALDQLLGDVGTIAEFTVFRPSKTETSGYEEIKFSIPRRKVTSESVKYKVSEADARVGIVNITGFELATAIQLDEAMESLFDAGCEYFVFDLRNNPGGALSSIKAVLSRFLQKGDLIVSTEYADGKKEELYASTINYGYIYEGINVRLSDIGKYKDINCVVLVNENTASAAELFTATFRDYGLAEIVGQTTFGKGCMQTILPLEDFGLEGALRVTSALYFSKSHYVYHEKGIVPDHIVELDEAAREYNFFLMPEEIDNQMQKAIEVLTNK